MPTRIHSQNLDANEAAFFSRQLEHVKAQTYDIRYPELKARSMFPVDNSAGPAADAITYRQWDQVGMAKIIANYANDLPRADVFGREFTSPVKSIGNAYGYNLQEIRKAAATGTPLQQRKANAARRAHEQELNRIAFFGDAQHGLPGLLNNPNIPAASVTADGGSNGGTTSTLWIHKTPTQILRDMNDLVHDIVSSTKGVEAPDTLAMPLAQYALIASTPLQAGSDTTILEFFLRNQQYVREVVACEELKGVGPGQSDVMIAYRRDPDCLTLEIPVEFEQLPVQEKGLEFEVPCHSRVGGLIVYRPLSLNIGEGI